MAAGDKKGEAITGERKRETERKNEKKKEKD